MTTSLRFKTWHAAAFLAAVSAASALSSSKDGRAYWRTFKRRQAATPPRWAFPAVWAGLGALQLFADLRILNRARVMDRSALLGLRAMSWGLYAAFAPGFFRAKSPVAAETVALAEGVTAGAAMALLARSDPLAAAALAPMTLWTAYTGLLHGEATAASGKPDSLVDRLRWQGAF